MAAALIPRYRPLARQESCRRPHIARVPITLSTMMLPWQVTIVPTFLLFRWFGWINTFLPLIVPSFFGGGAFNIFLLRQFFRTLPEELADAARIEARLAEDTAHSIKAVAIVWGPLVPMLALVWWWLR